MRRAFASLVLLAFLASVFVVLPSQTVTAQPASLVGRWRVKFTIPGIGEKNLVFDAQAKGSGSFLLLDAGPDNKPADSALTAAWVESSNNRVSFSGEVELPLGTCCRELGTLVFKGKQTSRGSISGRAIFIGITEDEENSNGFRTGSGTFTATRETEK
jgi:hypothetical protein